MVTVASFFVLLLLSLPIAFVMGWTSLTYVLQHGNIPGLLVPSRMFSATDNFILMAIPFFILAGSLMNAVGLTQQLVALSMALVGHIRGGLGMTAVVASMLFAGTTGSAAAEASALGTTLIPGMKKEGYSEDFAAAVIAAAATIGPIIPPSITAVVYGALAEVSVGALLLAGLIPGILMGVYQMAAIYVIARKRGYPLGERLSWRRRFRSFIAAIPALVTPVIIIGGIMSGIFTPTEAGAVAAGYALLLGLVWRRLTLRSIADSLLETGRLSASIMLIIATASVLSWIVSIEKVPQLISGVLFGLTTNPFLILLMINVLLLIVGCLMDTAAAMILLVPVLAPIAQLLGINPIQFGMIFVLNMVIGMATPPIGYSLFIACAVGKVSIDRISREIWPFILVSLLVLALVTYVPQVSLWFPGLFLTF